jgi:predicted outer membrane repeat protein
MSTIAAAPTYTRAPLASKLLPLVAAVAFCLYTNAHAATIMVNDTTAGSVPGKCTIVDAVTAINTQAAVNGCVAGDGAAGDGTDDIVDLTGFKVPTTISFVQAASGFSHALSLAQRMTIIGLLDKDGVPQVTLERSAAAGTPDFGLIQTSDAVTLSGLTLSNGSAQSGTFGGAIQAGSALTVNHCIMSGNASSTGGGAIVATNGVTLNNSTVTGNTAVFTGGGIVANSAMLIYQSTISNNSTTDATGSGGGGVYGTGSITVRDSTISGNSSASRGGGVYGASNINLVDATLSGNHALAGAGGAVFALNVGVDANRSTIDNNTASALGGGIYAVDASLANSTITGNAAGGSGGGVYAHTITMDYATIFANATQSGTGGGVNFSISGAATGTIIFGNLSGTMPDDLDTASHSALAGSHNLIGSSAWGVPADTINCNPMLGALGNYGGPTMTLPLASGSCAIGAASATPDQTADQRGYLRPAAGQANSAADIGAFERQLVDDPDFIFANGFE